MFEIILVAIGANLTSAVGQTPLATCQWAVEQLTQLPSLELRGVSRWFATQAVPVSDQPRFINGVVWLSGAIQPGRMLQALHEIEAAAGRQRGVPNAARTLDLDLLAMDGLVVTKPELTLPHPRLQHRAFVLAPLHDVRPDWRHPVSGIEITALVAAVANQDVQAL